MYHEIFMAWRQNGQTFSRRRRKINKTAPAGTNMVANKKSQGKFSRRDRKDLMGAWNMMGGMEINNVDTGAIVVEDVDESEEEDFEVDGQRGRRGYAGGI